MASPYTFLTENGRSTFYRVPAIEGRIYLIGEDPIILIPVADEHECATYESQFLEFRISLTEGAALLRPEGKEEMIQQLGNEAQIIRNLWELRINVKSNNLEEKPSFASSSALNDEELIPELLKAVQNNDMVKFKAVLEQCSKVASEEFDALSLQLVTARDEFKNTIFHHAVLQNNGQMINLLVDWIRSMGKDPAGYCVESRNVWNDSPVLLAVKHYKINALIALLGLSPTVTMSREKTESPVEFVLQKIHDGDRRYDEILPLLYQSPWWPEPSSSSSDLSPVASPPFEVLSITLSSLASQGSALPPISSEIPPTPKDATSQSSSSSNPSNSSENSSNTSSSTSSENSSSTSPSSSTSTSTSSSSSSSSSSENSSNTSSSTSSENSSSISSENSSSTSPSSSSSSNNSDRSSSFFDDLVPTDDLFYRWLRKSELILDKKWRLGAGHFGAVVRGVWRGLPVAVKILHNAKGDRRKIAEFRKEIKKNDALGNHPNIVKLIGAVDYKDKLVMVLEYHRHGSLFNLLFHSKTKLDTFQKLVIARDVALALLHLKKEKVVHRDLAARNVLITDSLGARVCDFGISRQMVDKYDTATLKVGAHKWMSPELLTRSHYTYTTDIWSYGVLLYELVAKEGPYLNVPDFVQTVCFPDKYENWDDKLHLTLQRKDPEAGFWVELIAGCMQFDPKNRISIYDILTRLNEQIGIQEADKFSDDDDSYESNE